MAAAAAVAAAPNSFREARRSLGAVWYRKIRVKTKETQICVDIKRAMPPHWHPDDANSGAKMLEGARDYGSNPKSYLASQNGSSCTYMNYADRSYSTCSASKVVFASPACSQESEIFAAIYIQ